MKKDRAMQCFTSFFYLISVLLLSMVQGADIFSIGLDELGRILQSGHREHIERVLAEEGALSVVGMPSDYKKAVRNIKSKAPICLGSLDTVEYKQFELPDGSQRKTFASSSESLTPIPHCIREEGETIRSSFDTVDHIMSKLISDIAGGENVLWRTEEDKEPRNFSSTQYKEHIHVYLPRGEVTDPSQFASPFHTDNGLLLLLTPFQDHPLKIKNKNGEEINTSMAGDDSLLVLVAAGLPEWLLKGTQASEKFFPAPHAVPSLGDISARTVVARMKVVPMKSFPSNPQAVSSGRKDIFHQYFSGHVSLPEDLCPVAMSVPQSLSIQARLVQKLNIDNCQAGTAYCWMNCLEVPDHCSAPSQCINKERLPCCTTDNVTGCQNMDSSCHWEQDCPQPTKSPEKPFCRPGSGTDMFMDGFTTSGESVNECVILLFKSWVLDTKTKFVIACFGVLLLGIAIEGMLCLRREIQSRKILLLIRGLTRRACIISLFALNIASGYLAMLVAMTYSVELFVCMVLGLVAGHAIFNTESPVGESVDPCCASQAIPHPNDSRGENTHV